MISYSDIEQFKYEHKTLSFYYFEDETDQLKYVEFGDISGYEIDVDVEYECLDECVCGSKCIDEQNI